MKELIKQLYVCAGMPTCTECEYMQKGCNFSKIVLRAAKTLEQKHGEWIGVSPMVDTKQCSVCGYNIISEEMETSYCPNCGAKMDMENKENVELINKDYVLKEITDQYNKSPDGISCDDYKSLIEKIKKLSAKQRKWD